MNLKGVLSLIFVINFLQITQARDIRKQKLPEAFRRVIRRTGRAALIPFSTKYPDQIIPDENVCLPRYDCSNSNTRLAKPNLRVSLDSGREGLLWTGPESGSPEAGPVDLPPEGNVPDENSYYDDDTDDEFEAVVAESENILIERMENECSQDRSDYCGQEKPADYLSSKHTMCKHCGLGEKCPYYLDPSKNDLTGRIITDRETQELIVQLHNEVRSKIARGACGQPKAGCMGPVVWDDELARVAQKWADQCANVDYKGDYKRQDPNLYHDPHPHRKVDDFSDWRGVGQSVARDISKGYKGIFNVTNLVSHWFKQIRLFDPEGVKSFGTGNQCSLGVGYYTQMVWENTTHVGCGWSQFQYRGFPGYFENFLVCNYGPAANIWKDPVYTIAETPCDCPCVDCDQETGLCPANPRYASWSSWGEWGRCTRSCGGGERDRKRLCTAPTEDGKDREPCPLCDGDGSEIEKCNTRKCPEWTEWTPWSECSVTCGEGDRTRQRVCGDGSEEPGACPGEPIEYETCNPGGCPAWTTWTPWTECSATCGGGNRQRLRECAVQRSADCIGEPSEQEECNTQACPIWTDWSEWTPCTKSCGSGSRTKVRECVLPKDGSAPECDGDSEVTEQCNTQQCPDWSPWSEWTSCSLTCGGGSKSRQRDCVLDPSRSNDYGCQGEDFETADCNTQVCPIWTEWTEWTECTATCGGGEQTRARECVLPKGVDGCQGDDKETRKCAENVCPVWTEWTEWTECSATCGGGSRYKVRECVLPGVRNANGLPLCDGPDKETEGCNDDACPILTEWSDWTECSVSCGGGTRFKRRECVYPKSGAVTNDCLKELEQQESCNENPCPEYSEWSDWTQCTVSCGGGTRRKVRECQLPSTRGGIEGCVGEPEVEESCNEQKCPVWTEWTDWTTCSATCGGGNQKRSRECVLPASRSFQCTGESEEERECNTNQCPDWTPWSEWSQCTKSCGGGLRTKLRECVLLTRGLQCDGEGEVTEPCNTDVCPIWTDWSEWTPCSQSCGGGTRSKVRECVLPKSLGGCEGDDMVVEECNASSCPTWTQWSEWTECSATCGGGQRRRRRDCVQRDGECGEGDAEEIEECNAQGCPGWSEWTPWTNCSEPCGGGFRERERECLVDGVRCICEEDKLCSGNFKEGESCNVEACPEWTTWGEWSSCSVTCGEGTQNRKRVCTGSGECEGDATESRECKDRSCVSWSSWTPWSSCSVTCGKGRVERRRQCGTTIRYLTECPGDDVEYEDCQQEPCSSWSTWGEWSSCSASCGDGTRSRTRQCSNQQLERYTGVASACAGDSAQTEACNNQDCKGWTEWSDWSKCSVTCGTGTKTRKRECSVINTRLGLLNTACLGASDEKETCEQQPCTTTTTTTTVAPTSDCGPANKFLGFNNRPATNIADCAWDYFGCTRRYGQKGEDCCMMRYKACCMIVMGMAPPSTTTTTTTTTTTYPEIDIDIDIDIGNLENPIDDIDLGNGTGVQRPDGVRGALQSTINQIVKTQLESQIFGVNRVNNENNPEYRCKSAGQQSLSLLLPDTDDCRKFISCQRRSTGSWIANPMSCPLGTGFDTELRVCTTQRYFARCSRQNGGRNGSYVPR